MGLNPNALVAVATVKEYIKLDGTADVALIENIINGVADIFERYTSSKFINIAITETRDGNGFSKIDLEFCPIVSLTSVKFDSVLQTLTDFKINSKTGFVYYQYGSFPEGFQNVEIVYTSGHGAAMANLPADVILAALKQCEYFYKRDASDFSETFEEGMILRAPSELLSPTVRAMLSPYYRNKAF